VNSLCTLRGSQAPEQGKHVPEVGLEPGSSPCKRWEFPETSAIRPSSAPVRPSPKPRVCTLCTPSLLARFGPLRWPSGRDSCVLRAISVRQKQSPSGTGPARNKHSTWGLPSCCKSTTIMAGGVPPFRTSHREKNSNLHANGSAFHKVSTHRQRRSGARHRDEQPQLTLRNSTPHVVVMVKIRPRALARWVKESIKPGAAPFGPGRHRPAAGARSDRSCDG